MGSEVVDLGGDWLPDILEDSLLVERPRSWEVESLPNSCSGSKEDMELSGLR